MADRPTAKRLRRSVGRHAEARCDVESCEWPTRDAVGRREVNALYAAARRHVRTTGHAVAVQDTYVVKIEPDTRPPERTVVVWEAGR